MEFRDELKVKPGQRIKLSSFDTRRKFGLADKAAGLEVLKANRARLRELQYTLYAENKQSLLVVLQGMDSAGKDGTIRHVMHGVNPQGCRVHSFKAPSAEELDHDFLWRVHKVVPPRGEIGIFNRSHYEDVLVVRVHDLVPKKVWSKRYDQINRFERNLAENGVTIIKIFLCISKDEQRERLQARIDNPRKNWKHNPGDLEERKLWDDYIRAYEAVLRRCSTDHAPWFVIPADRKWARNIAVSSILCETLESMKCRLPKPTFDVKGVVVE